ncbi:MAG: hypothetical protein H6622_09720 [Halobacteriovoraceae bacterium]|nr:hypothetical protein [Halobacteriovoraceae bacterium]
MDIKYQYRKISDDENFVRSIQSYLQAWCLNYYESSQHDFLLCQTMSFLKGKETLILPKEKIEYFKRWNKKYKRLVSKWPFEQVIFLYGKWNNSGIGLKHDKILYIYIGIEIESIHLLLDRLFHYYQKELLKFLLAPFFLKFIHNNINVLDFFIQTVNYLTERDFTKQNTANNSIKSFCRYLESSSFDRNKLPIFIKGHLSHFQNEYQASQNLMRFYAES